MMSKYRHRGETLTLQLGDFSNCVCAHLWNSKQLVLESEEETENVDEEVFFHKAYSGEMAPRCISSDFFGNLGSTYTPSFENIDLGNSWNGDFNLPISNRVGFTTSSRYYIF